MRRLPFLATLIGVVLLAVGLLITADAVARQHAQREMMQRDAAQVAASFASYFDRARSLDLLLAHNESLRTVAPSAADRGVMNRALQYLEVLYPDVIGEACLIDERGHELARVTRGRPAAAADLSADERNNAFFAPTFALGPNQVYQAAPYVSTDMKSWVISNSTWIRLPDHTRRIVHFEVSLASFLRYVDTSRGDHHLAVISGKTGQILLRDQSALPTAAAGRFPVSGWSSAAAKRSAPVEVDGHRVALRHIDRAVGNANDWYVADWTTAPASLLPAWVGLAGAVLGMILVSSALVVMRRQHSSLRAVARLDHLTGMANRTALEEALDDALVAASRSGGGRVALIVLDLDGFKQINDTLGHDKGDLVLQEIARRMHANVFEYDTAARLGGDEFAVVLRNLREADDVATVAHRLREALIRPIDINGVPRFVGASLGAAAYPDHARTSAELLRAADSAMYHAKRGHEGVRVYNPGTAAGADVLQLAADLMTAVETDQLELAFQPQFSVVSGEITGVESLARWNRRGHGPVSPAEFIPVAEQTGLIHSLTYLTLRRALDEVQVWRRLGSDVPVSVNLSAQMATDTTLPAQVSALLEERGLDARSLVLEITETTAIRDREGALEVLQRLRDTGVRIELDDFGTGYASFAALEVLPLDAVKLDRGIVADGSPGSVRLLTATIEFARRLGLQVVAEGIEDAATLDVVRRLGCDTAQGYHLARPTDADSVRGLLAQSLPVA